MTTRQKEITSYAQIFFGYHQKTIQSFARIRYPSAGDSYSYTPTGPFDSTEFDYVIWEELSREVVVRKNRAKNKDLDNIYGFEKFKGEEETIKAIVHNVTAKDGRLLDSGFANTGDFTLRFKKDADVDSRDTVYDPLLNITYDLVNWPIDSFVQTNHLWKQFIGKIQDVK